MKHTPGPWAIRDLEIVGSYESNKSICEITGNFIGAHEAIANLKLIAASPELLRLLEKVQEMFVHKEDDAKGNKVKSDIFKYCPEIGDLMNDIRQTLWRTGLK